MSIRDRARPHGRGPVHRAPQPLVAALLSLVVPGAGHLYAGDRDRGIRFLLITGLLVAPLFILFVMVFFWQGLDLAITISRPFFDHPTLLAALLVANALLLVFRAFVVLDSYYVAIRAEGVVGGAGMTVATGLGVAFLLFLTLLPHGWVGRRNLALYDLFTYDYSIDEGQQAISSGTTDPTASTLAPPSSTASTAVTTTTEAGPDPFEGEDRVNVLLMGGDSGVDREGIRTDTMIVVSIDPTTGWTAMFSVPRNNMNVLYPPDLPAYNAYDCHCNPQLLNLLYGWAFSHPELFPGENNPGGVAMKETLGYLLGIDIDYFALVDLFGFVDVIDALGGVEITVTERVYDPNYPHEDGTREVIDIQPGTYDMDGHTALAYARIRANSDDYNRMGRQRCVIEALAEQSNPVELLSELPNLVPAIQDSITTDIPVNRFPDFIDLLRRADLETIVSIRFIYDAPEFAGTSTSYVAEWIGEGYPFPNYELIQQTVATALSMSPTDAIAALNLQPIEETCG
ncbi:MAG: LCP family protein [Actinobacteria bacterium]|nr:LCP family protein [Actinomycetota bacterium]